MMLSDLERLLEETPAEAMVDGYREAIVDENVLGKATAASRQRAFRCLRKLYALEQDDDAFRALRFLWNGNISSRPLLALLAVLRRDPLLLATSCCRRLRDLEGGRSRSARETDSFR